MMESGATPDDTQWILWAATLGLESDLRARMTAATQTGCSRVSLSPVDVSLAEADGWSAHQIGRDAAAEGLRLVLDPVLNWSPGPVATASRFGRFTSAESMRMARDLGVASISVIGPREGEVAAADMLEPFASLCDQAADFGAVAHLEFIPMTCIPDAATAWAIVQGADRENGGILVDTWHFFRGNPDRTVFDEIPGSRILAVQVDDAFSVPLANLWDDTRERLMPGEGDLDLLGVLSDLHRIGGLNCVGPEVLSSSTSDRAKSDPTGVAQEAMGKVRDLVAQASAS